MGGCCSTERKSRGADGNNKYVKQELTQVGAWSSRPAPMPAPTTNRQKKQHKEANWAATGIVGLRDQGLKHLPQTALDIGNAVKVLDATNNSLRSLPAQLGQLVNLQRLILANNQLDAIPGDVLICLINMKMLNLDNNKLSALPEQLGQLPKLEKLTVSSNMLQSLPSLSSLGRLQQLSVQSNRLRALPDLPVSIEEVDASNNHITVIPSSYSSLVGLKILNLDKNELTSVPSEVLLHCAALHTLSLHANPIVVDVLQADPAYDAFEQRRRSKFNKVIAGGVLLGPKGLDEGVDRNV